MAEPGLPAYRWVPGYRATDGDLAAELGVKLGLSPDRNQRDILDGIFAEDDAGLPACFEVAVVAPRQNLKTAVLQVAAMTYLFVAGEELVIWTAHLFKTTQKAFEGMVKLIGANPDYKAKCRWPPRTANGDEAIELKTGQRIEFHARSKGSGRGFTGSKIILDEALFLREGDLGSLAPTLATMPAAQVLYASSAGLSESEALREIRNRGRRGGDPELAYWEFCAPRVPCLDDACLHTRDTPGCALDRRELWALANPALNLRITERRLGQFRRMMPPKEFRREFLGWWDDPASDSTSFLADWLDCADPLSVSEGRPVLAVDVSPNSRSTAVVAATLRPDGKTHIELVEHRAGVRWVAEFCAGLYAQEPLKWVMDPGGPAGVLLPDLTAVGIEPRKLTFRDLGRACEGLSVSVGTRSVAHLGDPIFTSAISGAGRRDIGDGMWAWSRRNSDVDISPLVAASLAWWGLATAEPPQPAPASPVIESEVGRVEESDIMSMGF